MRTKNQEHYEPRLVSEFVVMTWPNGIHLFDVPLGPMPTNIPRNADGTYPAGLARPARPRVDAIVIDSGVMYVIEGKIKDVSLGAGKLPMYNSLVPGTPELQDWKDLPRKMVLISANPAQWSAQAALTNDIILEVYTPEWVVEYMRKINTYLTPQAKRERDDRKKRISALGYDK